MNLPFVLFTLSFAALWFSAYLGFLVRNKLRPLHDEDREQFSIVQAATLTLLGLLIGFTFAMAVSRYDQRKNYEEAEANAIGTEYVRADLLPTADAARVRELLRHYLDQRVLFYTSRDTQQLRKIDADTVQLQNELWSAVQTPATAWPTPVVALVVSGMNDVLNSQGYTQFAWSYRLPLEALGLTALIAVGCNLLIGYAARRMSMLLMVVPLAVAVSFFLIADMDSPREGLIRVEPQNLVSLSQTLRTH